jgi:hypothetical protein
MKLPSGYGDLPLPLKPVRRDPASENARVLANVGLFILYVNPNSYVTQILHAAWAIGEH